MIKSYEKKESELLDSIAPCSMLCKTCTGCKQGSISYHAKELLKLLEGYEEFLEKNLKPAYRHKLGEYQLFHKKLQKYANPKCDGCRVGGHRGCSIENCFILECTQAHNVDFCAFCKDFPCDKVNEKVFDQSILEKWLRGNQKIKEIGIEKYYEEKKEEPHYINYKKNS